MAFRRPRLRLQPNVVSRPAPREPETTAAAPAAAPAPEQPAKPSPQLPAKPRPQLPARFKRITPRLDVGRATAEHTRPEGSTAGTPDGATAAPTGAVAASESCAPPASSPVSTPPVPSAASAGGAEPAADAVICPTPVKRPRLDSARLPDPPEPEDPDDPGRPAPAAAETRPETVSDAPPPPPPPPPAAPLSPPSPPLSSQGDGDSDGQQQPLLSETDLFLRKRFNAPRVKTNNRELLEQISERVSDNMPIRSKMRMQDLILWNPTTEAMSNSKEKPPNRRRKRRDSSSSVMSCQTEAADDAADDPAAAAPAATTAADPVPDPLTLPEPEPEPEEDAMPVPQLKVGPDGSIVIDEQSLVVKTSQQRQRDQELSTELVNDMTGSRLSFNGYRQRRKIDEWSIKETARFYKALSTVGTDFSIMQQLFPQRTRVDLKKKFKKEERKNPHLVERAMTDNMQYDLTIFDGDVWENTVENCRTAAQVKRQEEREQRRQERERDNKALKKEKAVRRPRPKRIKDVEKSSTAASILDSLQSPLETVEPPRRRPRGRENVQPPPEPDDPEPSSPDLPAGPLDWTSQGAGPAVLAPTGGVPAGMVAGAGAVVPVGATPWQPPGGQAGVLQLPAGVNPQNLLIIASPSPDRPDGQVLHVYMIQPPAGQPPDVNVTVPHNQSAPPPGQKSSQVLGLPWVGQSSAPPGQESSQVLGLPWVGQSAVAASAEERPGAPGQPQTPAAPDGKGSVTQREQQAEVEVVEAAAAVPSSADASESQPSGQQQGPGAAGVETQSDAESGDTAAGTGSRDVEEVEAMTGDGGEGAAAVTEKTSGGDETTAEEDGATRTDPDRGNASIAQQQDSVATVGESQEVMERDVLAHENGPTTTKTVARNSSEDVCPAPGQDTVAAAKASADVSASGGTEVILNVCEAQTLER